VLGKEFASEVLRAYASSEVTQKPEFAVRHTKWSKTVTEGNIGHRPEEVNSEFGHLFDHNIPQVVKESGYSRRDLFALFMQFKGLVALSETPQGIDKDTFRRSLPQLMVEDRLFIDRVYAALDADGSGTIEWDEFIEAMAKLEKGSREERAEFMFNVYDEDKGGSVDKEEMSNYFLSALRVHDDSQDEGEHISGDIASYFVDRVFDTIVPGRDEIERDDMINYVTQHPEITDIYGMFGRSMLTSESVRRMMGDIAVKSLSQRKATINMSAQKSVLSKAQKATLAAVKRKNKSVFDWKANQLRDETVKAASVRGARRASATSNAKFKLLNKFRQKKGMAAIQPSTPTDILSHTSGSLMDMSSPLASRGAMQAMRLTSDSGAKLYAESMRLANEKRAATPKSSQSARSRA
jgi:Ca2+-binding EF-hand superfamily protein